MDIEEEDKDNNNQIQQLQLICQNQQHEQVDSKIISNQIAITQKKKRIRAQWIPTVKKSLQSDSDPVYIYAFLRMMKNYNDEEYNKYRNYGLYDGGIGVVQQVEYDKVNQFLNLTLYTSSVGDFQFPQLISLYKSYQNQQYYDLALALEEYQVWSATSYQNLQNILKKAEQLPKEIVQQINGQLDVFEFFVKNWANQTFGNDIFELVIGNIDINRKMPVLMKNMFSKNLIYLIGSNLEDMYQNLSQQKNKDFLLNLLSGGKLNGSIQLEKTIKYLKETVKGSTDYEVQDELQTFDGFCIPTKKQQKVFYYDLQTRTISQEQQMQFIAVIIYHIEPHWIKYLIEKRQDKKSNFQLLNQQQNQNIIYDQDSIQDLDYICQKEYFIDKFYSSQKYKL